MSINGLSFLLLLLAAAVLYYLVPNAFRWLVLLAASGVFYLSYGWKPALVMLASVIFSYAMARIIDVLALKEGGGKRKKAKTTRQKLLLAAALIVNFSPLLILKYTGFFVSVAGNIAGRSFQAPSLLLPLGISFYIFQTSGYLLDVFRGKVEPQRNFLRYALFVCWFPQLVQGPINRYHEMRGPLFDGNELDWENIRYGILRMIVGILKKALIADPLAPMVAAIYGGYWDYPGIFCLFGSFLYCIQLYCDFSGGIDLVIGASRLFGVGMMENFKQPYFSVSLSDFWQRWHISLGEWMKDYLFYPLALSKGFSKLTKRARKVLPADFAKRLAPSIATFVVFLAVGMWQGPGWSNIAYGLWNGVWMSLGFLWVPLGVRLDQRIGYKRHKRLMTVWGVIRTNLLVLVGRYFSHATALTQALRMLYRTVRYPMVTQVHLATFQELGFTGPLVLQLLLALGALTVISVMKERGLDSAEWFCARKPALQFVVLVICLALIVCMVYASDTYVPIAYVYESV